MNDVFKRVVEKLKTPKLLVIIGLSGIMLIFLSSILSSADGETEKKVTAGENITAEAYRKEMEESVERLVKSITGSEAEVVITLESGIKYSYADINESVLEDKTESGSVSTGSELKQSYITVKTADGGEQALLVTTEMPEVRGVAIVCRGGDNEQVSEKIKNAVTAALNITSKRVYVTGGNSYEKR